jgi:hypothetical protein
MKFLRHIALSPGCTGCQHCIHFQGDPALIEATYTGLTSMSSGYASIRDKDGFCTYHERYLSGRDSCPDFTIRDGEQPSH